MQTTTVSIRNGRFETEVLEKGSGPPLLFLHGIAGLQDDAFVASLAQNHRVIAPIHPGVGRSTGDEHLLDLHDLLYYYLDFMDELGLRGLPLAGHSLGGMFAAELAALQPERFTHLVLLAPFGLWNDAHPVPDYFVAAPDEQARALFHDPESEAAKAVLAMPSGEGDVQAMLERVKSLRVAAKYLWPIPNRGFARRAHRVRVPAQVIWGEDDGVNPPAYAREFQQLLPDARVELVPDAAHMVHTEQPDRVAAAVAAFLAS